MEVFALILFLIGIFKEDKRYKKAAGALIIFELVIYAMSIGVVFLMNFLYGGNLFTTL